MVSLWAIKKIVAHGSTKSKVTAKIWPIYSRVPIYEHYILCHQGLEGTRSLGEILTEN